MPPRSAARIFSREIAASRALSRIRTECSSEAPSISPRLVQDSTTALLSVSTTMLDREVGIAQACVVWAEGAVEPFETWPGPYQLIDGHLRVEELGDQVGGRAGDLEVVHREQVRVVQGAGAA